MLSLEAIAIQSYSCLCLIGLLPLETTTCYHSPSYHVHHKWTNNLLTSLLLPTLLSSTWHIPELPQSWFFIQQASMLLPFQHIIPYTNRNTILAMYSTTLLPPFGFQFSPAKMQSTNLNGTWIIKRHHSKMHPQPKKYINNDNQYHTTRVNDKTTVKG